MTRVSVLAAQRARLLAILAGLAWMLGLMPSAPVRLLIITLVIVAAVLDALSDRLPAAIRITTLKPDGGDRR